MTSRDMPVEEFRSCGSALIEWISDYLTDATRYPILTPYQPGELMGELPLAGPVEGTAMMAILEDFQRVILPAVTHWNHPGFFAYLSRSPAAAGILGELLIAALDVNAMTWKTCPAATELEQVTAGWVLDWLGLPSDWFGMLVDSTSHSVLYVIVAARQRIEPTSRAEGPSGRLVAYVSEQTHFSVERALIAAGIGQRHVRPVAVDAEYRMRPDALARAIADDRANGLTPFFVAGTVGTTSSAAVDPIAEMAAICHANGVWLHVDGAYGGSFGIVPECRSVLRGVEHADSFAINPHKMMMVPIDCSLLYTRHPGALRSAFGVDAEYLTTDASGARNYKDYGLALGRRFRALKLWFVMRYFGREGLAAILRARLAMTAWLVERLTVDDRFELMAPPALGVICFALRQGDAATRDLMDRVNGSGRFYVSHTVLGGRFTMRVAIGNLRMEQRDVEQLWAVIAEPESRLGGRARASSGP